MRLIDRGLHEHPFAITREELEIGGHSPLVRAHFRDTKNQHTEPMRILLVEDDEYTQEMITAVLRRIDSNMDIEVAANGDHAIKRYLEGSHHDLVITDNVHPGVLGIELIELILARNPLQPIILQTGNCGGHIEAFKQKHRAILLLEEPYRLQQLQDMVTTVLHQGQPRN